MIYSSWDIEQNILKLVTFGHFLPFYPPKNPQNQNFGKWKKLLWYHHFTYVYQKSRYDVQFLRYRVTQTEFFVILGDFLPFYQRPPPPIPLMIPKIKIMKKKLKEIKKCLEVLSFYTYMCTINQDHMIYSSWNIRCDKQEFSSFWATFCPFSPLTTWKIKILKLKKTPGNIIILHLHHKWLSYDVWFLRYGA